MFRDREGRSSGAGPPGRSGKTKRPKVSARAAYGNAATPVRRNSSSAVSAGSGVADGGWGARDRVQVGAP